MHEIMNTNGYPISFRRAKIALGNTEPRYNSQVEGIRQKFYINSTRNSQQIPEWMGRTQSHYHRVNMKNRSMSYNKDSSFTNVKQTYVYENAPKVQNKAGPFHIVTKKKARTHWEMKNHTFQLQWVKPQQKKQKKQTFFTSRCSWMNPQTPSSRNQTRTQRDFTFFLPKYGINQSPLHVQKATPIKIGHKSTVDSIHIK